MQAIGSKGTNGQMKPENGSLNILDNSIKMLKKIIFLF